jgi:hypothetical protein
MRIPVKYIHVLLILTLFSCTGGPKMRLPVIPATPEAILGAGAVPEKHLKDFLLTINPRADGGFVAELAGYYVAEAEIEGINHDVAFAQMCLETGFLRFGGLVIPEMNNFCGLGALGPERPGEYFESPKTGVRAHIQHLKAYATGDPLKQDLVDPRYRYVRKGTAPTIDGLAGSWAADQDYAFKLRDILKRLYFFSWTRDRTA